MENLVNWVERNPWLAGLIGIGGVLILLWLFGFFSSSSSSSSGQGNSLAAAYYNAEAAQTTAGTQLQLATEAYAAQTAQDQIQATGAESIASTQANMYTTLGQQNAGTTTALGNDQLLAAENSNDDALAASNTAASFGYQTTQAQLAANEYLGLLGTVQAQFSGPGMGSGSGVTDYLPGAGDMTFSNYSPPADVNTLESMGYTPQGVASLIGLPFPGYTA